MKELIIDSIVYYVRKRSPKIKSVLNKFEYEDPYKTSIH